jgi:hypothetical protein
MVDGYGGWWNSQFTMVDGGKYHEMVDGDGGLRWWMVDGDGGWSSSPCLGAEIHPPYNIFHHEIQLSP